MNKVILMGRLTREPEIRYSKGEKPVAFARFTLAVDRRFRRDGDPEADFFNCVAIGRRAEFAEKYLNKGTKIVLSGRIENSTYTKKDGSKGYSTDIVVEDMEFAESKASSSGSGSKSSGGASNSAPSDDGFMNIPDGIDDELPFN